MDQVGPRVPACDKTHADKYRMPGEGFRESQNRVAAALKDDDEHYQELRSILLDMRFMFAGRIQASMGTGKHVTPFNCYVSGTIKDSLCATGGIMDRAKEAAATMRMGGGIGYDFSTLRPRGNNIRSLHSKASGPVSFMGIYDSVCRTIASAGHRRGAQMGVLRVDHPDVMEFIRAKQNKTDLLGFNVSLAITDEFMQAVKEDRPFPLRWGGQEYDTVGARDMWEAIMRSTWDYAEPGVLFIDRVNEMNNLWYCENIAATNPCAEQPLPPFGACLLGSFNLAKYVKHGASQTGWDFDYDQFEADIFPVVRAMDNVTDKAMYPLDEQRDEALGKRRMGIGVTGAANALEACGYEYGSERFCLALGTILEILRDEAYRSSVRIAKVKGPFEKFDRARYTGGKFIRTLPDDIIVEIDKYGIRNSHLLSIAPTGTISLCADNVSSGIEPVFAYETKRPIIEFGETRWETLEDYGLREFGVRGKRSHEVTAEEHVRVLATAQKYVDSSVSKTCNVDPNMPWDQFKGLYMSAFDQGCKGCTTYTPGQEREALLTAQDDNAELACKYDPETGVRTCDN